MDILLESFDETAISKVLLISCALTSQKLTYFFPPNIVWIKEEITWVVTLTFFLLNTLILVAIE